MKVELEKVKKRRQVIKTTASTHTHTHKNFIIIHSQEREKEREAREEEMVNLYVTLPRVSF